MPRLKPGMRLRAGLTLPELLVAMLLLAIVGGGITRVMIKQQQFYKDARASSVAKRELRLGASVLPAELRSISSSGEDILEMSEGEVTMRAYTGTSVICAISDPGRDDIWIPPTNLAKHTLTTFISASNKPQQGDTIFIFNEGPSIGSQDDSWLKRVITGADYAASDCNGAPYADPVLDATKKRTRYHLDAALPVEVTLGAVVRFTRPVSYQIYQETSGAWYLGIQEFTDGSWGTPAPLAGPYRAFASGDGAQSGLQFRFYDSLGVRITNMANRKDVARMDVFLRTMVGKSAITERKGADLQDSILMRVALRNFK
jgi:prepilin-type N-terminal cleavage/methylation domain-containing protein